MIEGAPRRGRDYTHEIIGQHSTLAKPASLKHHLINKYLIVLLSLIIITLGVVLFFRGQPSPLPSSVTQGVSYPIYYPSQPPAGYSLDRNNVNNAGNILSYSFKNYSGKSISVTIQAEPTGFDPKSLFSHETIPTTVISIGNMYDLSYQQQGRYMVLTYDKDLIFVTSAFQNSADSKALINSLKLVK